MNFIYNNIQTITIAAILLIPLLLCGFVLWLAIEMDEIRRDIENN